MIDPSDWAFSLREALTWSPPVRCPGPSTLVDLSPEAAARAQELGERYDLGPLLAATGTIERDESLYTLDLLDRVLERGQHIRLAGTSFRTRAVDPKTLETDEP